MNDIVSYFISFVNSMKDFPSEILTFLLLLVSLGIVIMILKLIK